MFKPRNSICKDLEIRESLAALWVEISTFQLTGAQRIEDLEAKQAGVWQ